MNRFRMIVLILLALTAATACQTPATKSRTETIEGGFGKVSVNLDHPQITALWLREPNGRLSRHSILATAREPLPAMPELSPHLDGAYTYIVERDGGWLPWADAPRHESRNSTGHRTSITRDASGRVTAIHFNGIKVADVEGGKAPVLEDWVLSLDKHGDLLWSVKQHWQRDAKVELSGGPAFFLRPFGGYPAPLRSTDPPLAGKFPNITSTIWYDPARLVGESHRLYEYPSARTAQLFALSSVTTQTMQDPAGWAVYKLFTNFGLKADIRLAAGGSAHLYRRGGQWAMFSEIGAQAAPSIAFNRRAGDKITFSVTLSAVDKSLTGHQLEVNIPDADLSTALKDLYGSLLNGGAVSNNKSFDFGNQSEGVNYAGGAGWRATAVAAGLPAGGKLSSRPFTADQALRGHLGHILRSVDAEGRSRYGYQGLQGEGQLDDNLNVIQASRTYFLTTGDHDFVNTYLPTLERMAKFYTDRIDAESGLFEGPPGAHWYYDLTRFAGYNTYINVFLFKALRDLADLQEVAGRTAEAVKTRTAAAALKEHINKLLWNEAAPGGPRYSDWIEAGARKDYFLDLVQWPAIAFGVATEEQAHKILRTADDRLDELKRDMKYAGNCTVSSLWPQQSSDNLMSDRFFFGRYTNGGCLLVMTYWEVVARAKAGDSEGAYQRLRKFATTYGEMAWVGNNAAAITGEMKQEDPSHGSGEPYLADMAVVPASLVFGILGVTPEVDELRIRPSLPKGWTRACVRIAYLGVPHRIAIDHGNVRVTRGAGRCSEK